MSTLIYRGAPLLLIACLLLPGCQDRQSTTEPAALLPAVHQRDIAPAPDSTGTSTPASAGSDGCGAASPGVPIDTTVACFKEPTEGG